jgi:flagellar assembly factor FliW
VIFPERNNKIHISSPDYGNIEIFREMIINFKYGVNGSSGPGGFVVLGLKKFAPFLVLVSEKKPHTAYPIMDPSTIIPGYCPEISDRELDHIGNPEKGSIQVVTFIELDKKKKSALFDLRHPILINVKEKLGKQVEIYNYPERFEIPGYLLRQ